jgi:hypothetical protein
MKSQKYPGPLRGCVSVRTFEWRSRVGIVCRGYNALLIKGNLFLHKKWFDGLTQVVRKVFNDSIINSSW